MRKKISILDWMLAIDFDNPELMKIAKKLENNQAIYVYSFIDTPILPFEILGKDHVKHKVILTHTRSSNKTKNHIRPRTSIIIYHKHLQNS